MDKFNDLINAMGITFEENIVNIEDFESSVELQPIPEILNDLKKGDI